jgi:hypothetical protein
MMSSKKADESAYVFDAGEEETGSGLISFVLSWVGGVGW